MASSAPPASGAQQPGRTDARRERRVSINSIVLPFLGSRADDFSPFQYLLSDLSNRGAKLQIPNWLFLRERLHKGDTVDLNAPFRFSGETYSNGEIVWERPDKEFGGQSCGVHFSQKTPTIYPVVISFDEDVLEMDLTLFKTVGDLMLRVLKDAILLKRGISIYLKHLAPYLSRVAEMNKQDFAFLRHFLLEDAAARVQTNTHNLQAVYAALEKDCSQEEIASCVSVEGLMEYFEPEIPADVFSLAFFSGAVAPYIKSIKTLEKKLYANYNTLMLLYLQSLQG